MSVNLLALCRHGEAYVVKRVKVTAQVQSLLEGIFTQQEQEFFDGITEEVVFDGGWRPEDRELLYVATPPAAAVPAAAQSKHRQLARCRCGTFHQRGNTRTMRADETAGGRLSAHPEFLSATVARTKVQPHPRRRHLQQAHGTGV
jgi:hypothetical protein